MKASRRLALAALVAVGVHGCALLLATRAPRAVPRPARPVEVAVLWPIAAPIAGPMAGPALEDGAVAARTPSRPPAPPGAAPPRRPALLPHEEAPEPAPSEAARDAAAAESPALPPRGAGPRRARASLLDRAIAGTDVGLGASREALEQALGPSAAETPMSEAERTRERANRFATPAPDRRAEGPRTVVVIGADGSPDGSAETRAEALGARLDGRRLGTKLGHGSQTLVLVRQKDGTLRYETGGFVAFILDDGTVRFQDAADVRAAPGPFFGNGRDARVNAAGDATLAEVLPFAIETPAVPLLSVEFDVNAPLLRAQGNDPFSAEKSCFLDDTRALRDELAADARARRDTRSLQELEARLDALLRTKPVATVKREVVAWWDDCSPDEESGRRARALIERFVAARMPAGSPFGFDADELAAINAARPPGARFEPYG
jgi:hypothetical protein